MLTSKAIKIHSLQPNNVLCENKYIYDFWLEISTHMIISS